LLQKYLHNEDRNREGCSIYTGYRRAIKTIIKTEMITYIYMFFIFKYLITPNIYSIPFFSYLPLWMHITLAQLILESYEIEKCIHTI